MLASGSYKSITGFKERIVNFNVLTIQLSNFIRLTFILLFARLSLGVFAQTVVEVTLLNCEYNEPNDKLSFCVLYAMEGNRSKEIAQLRPSGQSHFFIDTLQPGNYKLLFPNQHPIILTEQEFELIAGDTTEVTLCLDRFKNDVENHVSVINALEHGESYWLFYESHGCFHLTKDSIQVMNKEGKIQFLYHQKIYALNAKKIDAIISFEYALNQLNPISSCTTHDYYWVRYKEEERKFKEGACSWRGWTKLIDKLGLT